MAARKYPRPGKAMDHAIARKVMGVSAEELKMFHPAPYSTNLNYAWKAIQALGGVDFTVYVCAIRPIPHYWVSVAGRGLVKRFKGRTQAYTICVAALVVAEHSASK